MCETKRGGGGGGGETHREERKTVGEERGRDKEKSQRE